MVESIVHAQEMKLIKTGIMKIKAKKNNFLCDIPQAYKEEEKIRTTILTLNFGNIRPNAHDNCFCLYSFVCLTTYHNANDAYDDNIIIIIP